MSRAAHSAAAALIAVLLTAAAAPRAAAAAAPADPSVGTLPGGLSYELRPDTSQPCAAVALWYRAPAGGFEATPAPGVSRLAALTVAASTPITGTPLSRLIQDAGGRLSIAAYPESVAITALVPRARVADVVRAMTADYFAPVTDDAGLAVAQRDAAEDALYRSYDPSEVVEDALGSALFTSGPFHDGTLPAPRALGGVTLARVRAFAERAFRPSNAILVVTGDVDADALNGVATREGANPLPDAIPPRAVAPSPAPVHDNANIDAAGLGWTGPPITDETAATALDFAADALFAPATGSVQRALGSLKAEVTGKFVTYRDPGLFLVTISGPDAEAARPIVLRTIAAAASPMDNATFRAARAGFIYRLLTDLQTPAELADTYGWYAVEGNPGYAPSLDGVQGRYFTIAAGLTPRVVAHAIAQYLLAPPGIVTVVHAVRPPAKPS